MQSQTRDNAITCSWSRAYSRAQDIEIFSLSRLDWCVVRDYEVTCAQLTHEEEVFLQ